jgi:hypothetical protein
MISGGDLPSDVSTSVRIKVPRRLQTCEKPEERQERRKKNRVMKKFRRLWDVTGDRRTAPG